MNTTSIRVVRPRYKRAGSTIVLTVVMVGVIGFATALRPMIV
jgi:hypothetical protein